MADSFAFMDRLKGFLTQPVETFQKVRDEEFMKGFFPYYVVLLVIYAILSTIVFAALGTMALSVVPGMAGLGALGAVVLFVAAIVGGIIGLFIGGIILHIFVYLVGGRKGYMQTVKALMFAATPNFLLGWIPIISIISSIWSLILVILGIRELHQISMGKAILAVVLLIIVVVIIVAAVTAAFLFSMPSGMSSVRPYY